MSKTFSYAGVSTLDNVCKFRVANDAMRVKVLAKNGHTSIDIIQLKEAMTKEDAVAFLLKIDFDNGNAIVRAALEAELEKRDTESKPKAVKEPKAPKVPKEPKVKAVPTMAGIKAKVAAAKASAEPALSKAEITAQLAGIEDAPY